MKKKHARVRFVRKTELLNVWLWHIVGLLNLDDACDDKLGMLCSRGRFLLAGSIVRHGVDTMALKLSPLTAASDSTRLELLKRKRLFFRIQGHRFMFFTLQRRRAHRQDALMDRVTILALSIFFMHGHEQPVGAIWEGSSRLRNRTYFSWSHVLLKD